MKFVIGQHVRLDPTIKLPVRYGTSGIITHVRHDSPFPYGVRMGLGDNETVIACTEDELSECPMCGPNSKAS